MALALVASGCGLNEERSALDLPPGAASKLKGAPRPLSQLHSSANKLIGGGVTAFKGQMAKLRGYPVVVNKWASWCGPCRVEFPFFRRASIKWGRRVAFLGVDSHDGRGEALRFLSEEPVTYPSFSDPDGKIEEYTGSGRGIPATVFYSPRGEIVKVHIGGYADQGQLEGDIKRYAQ